MSLFRSELLNNLQAGKEPQSLEEVAERLAEGFRWASRELTGEERRDLLLLAAVVTLTLFLFATVALQAHLQRLLAKHESRFKEVRVKTSEAGTAVFAFHLARLLRGSLEEDACDPTSPPKGSANNLIGTVWRVFSVLQRQLRATRLDWSRQLTESWNHPFNGLEPEEEQLTLTGFVGGKRGAYIQTKDGPDSLEWLFVPSENLELYSVEKGILKRVVFGSPVAVFSLLVLIFGYSPDSPSFGQPTVLLDVWPLVVVGLILASGIAGVKFDCKRIRFELRENRSVRFRIPTQQLPDFLEWINRTMRNRIETDPTRSTTIRTEKSRRTILKAKKALKSNTR